jgi:hypothetical protein
MSVRSPLSTQFAIVRSYLSHSALDKPKLAKMIGKSWNAKFSAARWKLCQFVKDGGVTR